MKKLKNYLVSVSYEDKCDLFHNITAHTKSEAEMLVISLFLLKDSKYNCRPLTTYKLKSCLEDYKRRR
ncbi:MAG: hypothetical protein J5970_01170 [Bacilli bacterium]|nr:hypothetical protein [Bacilli bacterium]